LTNNRSSSAGRIQEIETEALEEIHQATDVEQLEAARIKFLGRKGLLTVELKRVGSLPSDQRKSFGIAVNQTKKHLTVELKRRFEHLRSDLRQSRLRQQSVDVTLPGRRRNRGGLHPVTRTVRRINEIFQRIGFDIAEGPEIEDDFHNFEALNIPIDHPARAMHDTFYVNNGDVLRTHTSPVQIRYMKTHNPPLQVIAPGRVYRCDSDVTHTPMFHQVEGLVVDNGVSFADLKGVLTYFVHEFFESDLPLRFRPSYFPFTEPSAEVDIGCIFCSGSGCRICQKTGWLEILGCGMVHPQVFHHVGINYEEHTGYAFGLGIERVTMLRYGVDDLRLFFNNEIGFLSQFR
jgi:phenylalanyl-tRNA synthetase alpha chain